MRSLGSISVALVLLSLSLAAMQADVIRSTSAVPPHLSGRFRDPTGFQQAASGQYFVFDRRSHVVFGIDEPQTSAWEIVHIGAEPGRIIDPTAFSLEPGGTFAAADAPNNQERALQLRGAGALTPTSMFFTRSGRLLVTPGLYEFDTRSGAGGPAATASLRESARRTVQADWAPRGAPR
jgi:hypothetical protein